MEILLKSDKDDEKITYIARLSGSVLMTGDLLMKGRNFRMSMT
jgi:hypothetical protein